MQEHSTHAKGGLSCPTIPGGQLLPPAVPCKTASSLPVWPGTGVEPPSHPCAFLLCCRSKAATTYWGQKRPVKYGTGPRESGVANIPRVAGECASSIGVFHAIVQLSAGGAKPGGGRVSNTEHREKTRQRQQRECAETREIRSLTAGLHGRHIEQPAWLLP